MKVGSKKAIHTSPGATPTATAPAGLHGACPPITSTRCLVPSGTPAPGEAIRRAWSRTCKQASARGRSPGNWVATMSPTWKACLQTRAMLRSLNTTRRTTLASPRQATGIYDTRTVPTGNFEYIHVKDLIKRLLSTADSPPGGKQGVAYSYTFAASGYPARPWPAGCCLWTEPVERRQAVGYTLKRWGYSFAVKASNSAGSVVSPTRTVTITAKPGLSG